MCLGLEPASGRGSLDHEPISFLVDPWIQSHGLGASPVSPVVLQAPLPLVILRLGWMVGGGDRVDNTFPCVLVSPSPFPPILLPVWGPLEGTTSV